MRAFEAATSRSAAMTSGLLRNRSVGVPKPEISGTSGMSATGVNSAAYVPGWAPMRTSSRFSCASRETVNEWNRRLRLRQHGLGLSEFTVGSNARIPALLHEFDEMVVGGDLLFGKDSIAPARPVSACRHQRLLRPPVMRVPVWRASAAWASAVAASAPFFKPPNRSVSQLAVNPRS